MSTRPNKIPNNPSDDLRNSNSSNYRDGYLYGRETEHDVHKKNLTLRENNSAAKGLLIGIGLTAITGLLGAAIFFLTQAPSPSTKSVETAPVPSNIQPQNP